MKMGSSWGIQAGGLAPEAAVIHLVLTSPRVSLVWTSLRTLECRSSL